MYEGGQGKAGWRGWSGWTPDSRPVAMCLSAMSLVVAWVLPLAASQFVPPEAILQAGYPAGFRAFIPDFPGCEMFAFHAKINSPFLEDEAGTFSQEILRPDRGFWVFQDPSTILTPGDILHYWTLVVKDGVGYSKRNQTWEVPGPDESVDLLSPVTLKPPRRRPNPEKMIESVPTAQTEDATTPMPETTSVDEDTTTAADPDSTEISTALPDPTSTSAKTSPPTTAKTSPPTTPKPSKTTKQTPKTSTSTTKPTTTKKPQTTTSKPKPKKSTTALPNPLMENVEELTTPVIPFDKPISSEFPQEPPPLFPFPSLYPRPFKPMMPPTGPGFEICSNPWNFEEQPGDSRTSRLERQVAKLQCQLAMFQRGYTQLGNNVENELTDLKKLIYGMVGRMARLESVIRSAAFG